jgi:hypothetical protein
MSELSTADTDHVDRRINQLGASLFFDPLTVAHASDAGVDDVFSLYAGGRAGVMGNVTATQVAVTLGFFPATLVRTVWADVEAIATPARLAGLYADAMIAAAIDTWDRSAAAVVVELGSEVAASVPLLGLPLFAGWRERNRPSEPVGAAVHVVHTLRELRGDIHVQSVAAEQLDPLEAEIVTRGEEGATLHGWPQPWPDPAAFVDRVAAAESATGARMRRIYADSLGNEGFATFAAAIDGLAPA